MAENLLRGEAQLIAASLTITPQRSTVLDFLPVIGTEDYVLWLYNSGVEDISWRTFVVQFKPDLWYVILVMICLFWLAILGASHITMHKSQTLEVSGL